MASKIIWSPRAEKSFISLVTFLEHKWERKVVQSLFDEVERALSLIASSPELYPLCSEKRKLRKCVIKSRILLFYRIKGKTIELVVFVDGRQNPKKYLI